MSEERNMNNHQPKRRNFVRIPVDYFLECTEISSKDTAADKVKSATKNMSAGGILFSIHKKYEIGVSLKLSLNVSEWDKYRTNVSKSKKISYKEPLDIVAKVVRVDPSGEEGKYNVAVEFTGMDEEHRSALSKFIQKKL